MDDKRFDNLAKLVGKGSSRRSILKGLFGLGGSAVAGAAVTGDAEARRVIGSPRIPPPPEPTCSSGQSECGGSGSNFCCDDGQCFDGVCCPTGQSGCGAGCCATGQCTTEGECCAAGREVCRSICCPTGQCAREFNNDICCTDYVCGLECCETELQCCDRECCPADHTCLTRVFAEGPLVQEETCCPTGQTCDNQCCDGECFTPLGTSLTGFDRACCPPEGNLCPGAGAFANVALCCSGDTPDCCANPDGSPICLTTDQCCTADECTELTNPAECLEGVCADFLCDAQFVCGVDERCCEGGVNICCPTAQAQVCCGPTCCTEGLECCEREVQGELTFTCYQADAANACCLNRDCPDNPAACMRGICNRSNQTCELRPICDAETETCCEGAGDIPGLCITGDQCCFDNECTGSADPATCRDGVCNLDSHTCEAAGEDNCPTGSVCCPGVDNVCCPSGQECCGSACINLATQCCDDDHCSDNPAVCERGECDTSTFTCSLVPDCDSTTQTCCPEDGACITTGQCCTSDQCTECDACIDHQCVNTCDEGLCCFLAEQNPQIYICFSGECCPDDSGCEEGERCCTDFSRGTCYDPNEQCCSDPECGDPCAVCIGMECVFTCEFEGQCCDSGFSCVETLNEGLGGCVVCRDAQAACSNETGPGCCEDRSCCGGACCDQICISDSCVACISFGGFGCESFADCCDDGSKWCRVGLCSCTDAGDLCIRDGGECCDGLICHTSQEINHPFRGRCTEGTCSDSAGEDCPCCAGLFCTTEGTCADACNFSPDC